MKRINLLLSASFLLLLLSVQSCVEDGSGPFVIDEMDSPPTITLSVEGSFGAEGINIDAGETFVINVGATAGSTDLRSLTVQENGVNVDLSRILQDGQAISGNPKLLLGTDKASFSTQLTITSSSEEVMSAYTVKVEDEIGLTAVAQVDVSTMIVGPTLKNNSTGVYQVPAGSLVSINVEAIRGSSPLSFINIGGNGETSLMDHTRFFYGDTDTPFDGNPFFIPEADKDGFVKDIYIRAQTDGPATQEYRIFIFDENEKAEFFDIVITTGSPTNDIFGVLFNAAGPEGRGGLDLDEGIGTGSMSLLAEIKDEGIDLNETITENWKRQISGVNGSIVRSLVPGMSGLSETYSFMNEYLREDLPALFEAGIDFTVTNANMEVVSSKVNVGDSFAVKNGENYYLIFIREVNETTSDNGDNYVIDIKQ